MRKYLLAISGGIDSMALLDMVAMNHSDFRQQNFPNSSWPADFMVLHFNHGIRPEAISDAGFVKKRCRDYGVECIVGSTDKLSFATSEEQARRARYDFFESIMEKYRSQCNQVVLITAHHLDDVVESVIINLSRGTGWRGLVPMSRSGTIRPLANTTKADLVKYVIEHNLSWVEDSTNDSPKYLRNRIRMILGNLNLVDKHKIMKLVDRQAELAREIKNELEKYGRKKIGVSNNEMVINRYDIIMLPQSVAIEVLHLMTSAKLTRPQLVQLCLFAKTAKTGKKTIYGNTVARVDKNTLYISQRQGK